MKNLIYDAMRNPLYIACFTAIMFGTWPIVTRFAQINPYWLGFILSSITALITFFVAMYSNPVMPAMYKIGIVAAAGILNGLGTLGFGTLISWQMTQGGKIDFSKYFAIIFALNLLIGTFGNIWLFKSDILSVSKMIGIAAIAAGIYFLNR